MNSQFFRVEYGEFTENRLCLILQRALGLGKRERANPEVTGTSRIPGSSKNGFRV